jgi:hypothetical protein
LPPLVGATLMFLIRCVKDDKEMEKEKEMKEILPLQPVPQIAWDQGELIKIN